MGESKRMVGIGMIGVGRWANAHGDAARRSDRLRIVNCYARTEQSRTDYQQRYDLASTADSLDELLADQTVEAVVI